MKIAILGWGSLIWNPGSLKTNGDWRPGGPRLPIEFTRISDDGRLTLVIDERHGVEVPTRYAVSASANLDEAIENLRERERCPTIDPIGYVDLKSERASKVAVGRHAAACDRIKAWAGERKLDAVIWTALGPRFKDKIHKAFSVEAAVNYLVGLEGDARTKTFEYIRNAPIEVMTPVRRAAIEALPELTPVSPSVRE